MGSFGLPCKRYDEPCLQPIWRSSAPSLRLDAPFASIFLRLRLSRAAFYRHFDALVARSCRICRQRRCAITTAAARRFAQVFARRRPNSHSRIAATIQARERCSLPRYYRFPDTILRDRRAARPPPSDLPWPAVGLFYFAPAFYREKSVLIYRMPQPTASAFIQ